MARIVTFTQPKVLRHAFVLSQDGTQVGTLDYQDLSHHKAHAKLRGKTWRIVQKGWFDTKISITEEGSTKPAAVYEKPMFKRKGWVVLGDDTLQFSEKSSLLKARFVWLDGEENEVIGYKYTGFIRTGGEIALEDSSLSSEEEDILTVLGLFIGLNVEEDEGSVAAAS